MSEDIDLDHEPEPIPDKPLSARHRKLAELLALGHSNKQIKAALGYCDSRISILKGSEPIQKEVRRIMDASFEQDVKTRLRNLSSVGVDILEEAINDQTGRVSMKEKVDVAKYLVDQSAGKAVQKHEVSGGVLLGVIDKLDALKASGKGLDSLPAPRDVTPPDEVNLEDMTEEEREEYEMVKRWQEGF